MDYTQKVTKKLLTVKELALYLGKSQAAIYQLVARRQIPYVKLGRSVCFDIPTIDEWLKSNSIECMAA